MFEKIATSGLRIAAAVLAIVGIGAGVWIWKLESALVVAERAEAAALDLADGIAVQRARAVEAQRTSRRELEALVAEREDFSGRLAELRARLAEERSRLGIVTTERDELVSLIGHAGPVHRVVLAEGGEDCEFDAELGFLVGEVYTAGGRAVLVGSVWSDISAGGKKTRIEDAISADLTRWWRAPAAEAGPPSTARPREWAAIELELAASWRRIDGDMDWTGKLKLVGPELRSLWGGQPFVAIEAELSDGMLRDRYIGGASWRRSVTR